MFRMILVTLGALFGFLAWFGTPEMNPRLADASAREAAPAPQANGRRFLPPAMVQEVRMQVTPVQVAPAPAEAAPAQTAPAKPRFPGPPLEPSPQYADAPAPAATAPAEGTLTVSGDRVNLRAGPGTEHAVVGAVARGTAVTPVGPTTGAWVEVRDASGLQGFISARFLSPRQAE